MFPDGMVFDCLRPYLASTNGSDFICHHLGIALGKGIYCFLPYFVASLVISILIVPFMHTISFTVGAVDKGTGRRVHDGVIPRLGGVGIFVAFFIPVLFLIIRKQEDIFHDKLSGIFFASIFVFSIGVYDDIKGASIRQKLFAEIIGAIIIYAWGVRIDTIANPFGNTIHLGLLSLPMTVIWVVIITNAINLIDGIDGLAAGTCVLIAGTLFLLSSDVDSSQRLSYVILIGSLLGFLRYNFPPASIFMGDSGSLFLGFFLASASILSTQKTTAAATILIPIIAFGLPLTDMFYAVLRRYYRGLPFGTADRDHIHHKLIEKGLSRKKVVLFLYSLNVCIMVFLIVLFSQQRPIMDFVFLCILLFIACIGSYFLGYIKIGPFIKTTIRNFKIGKDRKYFNYVIRRFRRSVLISKNLDDFKSHISVVAQEYNFVTMEIHLDIPSVKSPFYLFSSNCKSAPEKEINLSFPILNQGNYMGNVKICKELASGRFLCVSEMIDAISEEIVRFVTTNRDLKPE